MDRENGIWYIKVTKFNKKGNFCALISGYGAITAVEWRLRV